MPDQGPIERAIRYLLSVAAMHERQGRAIAAQDARRHARELRAVLAAPSAGHAARGRLHAMAGRS